MTCVGAVILAAGLSRRMDGPNKLLLPVDGVPMVRRTVQRVHDAGASPVVVVTGRDADEVQAALTGLPCTFTASDDPGGPTSASLHAGLRALPGTVDATLVVLADMVHVTTAMVAQVAAALEDEAAPLAVSVYGDVPAPPLAFRRRLWPELLAWHGEGCGKAVVRAHWAEARLLAWPPAALDDIDTPADYAGLIHRTAATERPHP